MAEAPAACPATRVPGVSTDIDSAPLMAASIFLDALNVFQFFLRIFSRNN